MGQDASAHPKRSAQFGVLDEEFVHRVTDATGPGSPGGFTLPGRARVLDVIDQGSPFERMALDQVQPEEPGRGTYLAPARVGPPDAEASRGRAEAMAEGRMAQPRPSLGSAEGAERDPGKDPVGGVRTGEEPR
jgi:hypothetical protein